jgi:hypothetical protein
VFIWSAWVKPHNGLRVINCPGQNLSRKPPEYQLTVLGQLTWCETPKSVIQRACGVHQWFSPDEKSTTHIIYYYQSYVARAVCRRSLLLRHDRITRCGNDKVSLYVVTLSLLAGLFFFSWALLVLLFCPMHCQGFFLLLMWCGEFLHWTTTVCGQPTNQNQPKI